MDPRTLTAAIEGSGLARWLHSGWVFPAVESLHIVGFALLFGAIAVLDARLLGVRAHASIASLMSSALPLAGIGFLLAVLSGTLLFVANASELIASRTFAIKMGLLMLAGVNAAAFHAGTAREALRVEGPPTAAMRAAGAVSLLIWIAVIVCGRLIAYT